MSWAPAKGAKDAYAKDAYAKDSRKSVKARMVAYAKDGKTKRTS